MSDVVIQVENLSKRYRIGSRQEPYGSLRESIVRTATAPVRRLRASGPDNQDKDIIWALKDVSFEVKRGQVVGVIGRNGAGKSTLLKILSRITKPTKGQVRIKGRVGSLLEVGTGFHPELTGRENIYLNGAILGMRRAEINRKFDEIVDFAGIEKFLDTPIKRYSSGMFVRLAFAVAAHLEPEILLIDEVLAVGDTAFQKKCLGKMKEVSQEGRTVLFVSHNLGAIASLCERAINLHQGKLVRVGEVTSIIGSYIKEDVKEGFVNLSDWVTDRKSPGPMKITYLATMDDNGNIKSQFVYGEPIRFNIGIMGEEYSGCIIGVSIRDEFGRLILHLNNTDDSKEIVLKSNESVITADLINNVLNDGTYYITIWLGDDFSILNDRVGNCLAFRISSASLGNIRSLAPIRLPSTWNVAPRLC